MQVCAQRIASRKSVILRRFLGGGGKREGVQSASHVRQEESPSWWLSFDDHVLHHGNLSLFMCWSGCSRDKTTTPVKKLHKLPFWAATSPLCSVVEKRSLGKRICNK